MAIASPERIATHHERLPSPDFVTERIYLKYEGADFSYVDATDNPAETIEILVSPSAPLDAQSKRAYLEEYLWDKAERDSKRSWWETMLESVRTRLVELPEGNRWAAAEAALYVRNVHEFTVQTDHGADGKFEVIECGEDNDAALRPRELQALGPILTTLDQFSGGVLANTEQSQRILTTTAELGPSGRVAGLANDLGVLLNMRRIREIADQIKIDSAVMLGVVLAHELLAHKMNYLANGTSTTEFEKHFDYSDARKSLEFGYQVHEQITPKDPDQIDSQPVREYGWASADEDFATTVDAMYASVTGTSDLLRNSERFASTPDPYREDLAMAMFDAVARAFHEQTGKGLGYIGSPVSYVEIGEGQYKEIRGRQLEYATIDPARFIREEVEKWIAAQHIPTNVRFDNQIRFL